jgi:hypothetical protein
MLVSTPENFLLDSQSVPLGHTPPKITHKAARRFTKAESLLNVSLCGFVTELFIISNRRIAT